MRLSLKKDERGVALVEFTLVLPLLLLLLLGIVDFGRVLHHWQEETQLAAEGARQAAVDRAVSGGSLQSSIRARASTRELREGGSSSVPDAMRVCIDFPEGTSRVGDPVRVRATATYNFLPFLNLAVTSKAVTGEATMRLEAPPSNYAAGCS